MFSVLSTDTCSWLSHDSTHSSPDDTKLPLGEPGAGPEQPANIQAKRGTMSKQHLPNYLFSYLYLKLGLIRTTRRHLASNKDYNNKRSSLNPLNYFDVGTCILNLL